MNTTNQKNISFIQMLAIFALPLISMGFTVVTPAMAKLAAAFPGQNFTLISTLPTLAVVPTTLWAGSVAGKKIKYRTLAIIGCIIFIIFGTLPAFVNSSFEIVILSRAIFGLGLGLMAPLGNALILGMYKGQKQATFLGYGTLIMNGGGILLQMAGGALAEMQWNYTFYGHLIGLISLVFLFFLPEPEQEIQIQNTSNQSSKVKIGKAVFVISMLMLLYNMLNFPVMLNLSLLFELKQAGGAAVAATTLSMFTVAGCISGFFYGNIVTILKRYSISFGIFISAIGAFLVYWGKDALIMTIGIILLGFASSIIMPSAFSIMGMRTNPAKVAMGTSIITALMNFGGFVSSFWLQLLTQLFGENIYSALMIEIIIFAIFTVVFLIYDPFPKMENSVKSEA